ncbi:hypothetical protein K6025_02800 [Ehrlichia sp. JZT12]
MNKSRYELSLYIAINTMLVVIVLYCFLFKNSKLMIYDIFFILLLNMLSFCITVSITHLVAYNYSMWIMYEMFPGAKRFHDIRGYGIKGRDIVAAASLAIKEKSMLDPNQGCVIFIPLVAEGLNSMLIDSIELKYGENPGESSVVLTENRGLLPSKVMEFGLSANDKFVTSFDISILDRINSPGLYVLVRNGSGLKICSDLNMKSLKISSRVMLLTYEGYKKVENTKDLKCLLLDYLPEYDYMSIGEALIRKLLINCPGDEPGMKLWISQPRGQIAIKVLHMLNPVELLNGQRFRENRKDTFNKQFTYLVDYVKRKRYITISKNDIHEILKFVAYNVFFREKVFASKTYEDLDYNFCTNVKLALHDMIQEDEESTVPYDWLFIIASCQHSSDECVKMNSYIKELVINLTKIGKYGPYGLMRKEIGNGDDYFITRTHNKILSYWDIPIAYNELYKLGINTAVVLREMSNRGMIEDSEDKKYTGREFVEIVRSLITQECKHRMTLFCRTPSTCTKEVISRVRIVSAPGKTSEVKSGIENVVSDNIASSQNVVL